MADWICLYFQRHLAGGGTQRKRKCSASSALMCAFFCLLWTTCSDLCAPHPRPKYDFFNSNTEDIRCLSSTVKRFIENTDKDTVSSFVNYHVFQFLAQGPRGVSGDGRFDTVKWWSGMVEAKWMGWGIDALPARFGAQCHRSGLSIVIPCHPSEATPPALNVANPLCSALTAAVCWSDRGLRQKFFKLDWVDGGEEEGSEEEMLILSYVFCSSVCMGLAISDNGPQRVCISLSL